MAWATTYEISRPYEGFLSWWLESAYGNDSNKSTASDVAEVIGSARFETGEVNRYYRSIDSFRISKTTQSIIDYVFHLEYHIQHDDEILKYLMGLDANTHLWNLGFELGIGVSSTTATYAILKGCKVKTCEVNGSEGEGWAVSADFSVKDVSTSTAQGSTVTTQVNQDLCMFNIAGSIIADSKEIADVVQSFTVRVDNNIDDIWSVGSRYKERAIRTAVDYTGTCDISMDEGGKPHLDDVISHASATTLVIMTAGAGSNAPKITLTNTRWDSAIIDAAAATEGIIESCPFTSENLSVTSC